MAKKKKSNALQAIYIGDTKNFNKFAIVKEGYTGTIYFPIEKDIEDKEVRLNLVTPSNDDWAEKMEDLIDNTNSPKAVANLKKCLKEHR